MDVDLLRPGTVPISKDTNLWFEFLLNPNSLEEHLKKTKPGTFLGYVYVPLQLNGSIDRYE